MRGSKLSSEAKKAIIREKDCSCERCGLKFWMGLPAKLEFHHVDCNKFNNCSKNLQVLCLQCHSQTPNWRRTKPKVVYKCELCEKLLTWPANKCRDCYHTSLRRFEVSKEELLVLVDKFPLVVIAK